MKSAASPSSRVKGWLLHALLHALLLTALVLAAFAILGRWSSASLSWTFDLPALFWLVVASVVYLPYAAFCWQCLLRRASGAPAGFAACLQQTTMMQVGKYIPGKVWGIALRGLMAREAGMSSSLIVVLSLVEMIIVIACGVAVAAAAYLSVYSPLLSALCLATAPVVVGLGLRSLALLPTAWAQRLFRGLPDPRTIAEVLGETRWTLVAAAYLGNWLWLFVVIACVFRLCGLDLVPHEVVVATGAYAAAVVVGFLALFAPGGIGVREGVFVATMAGVVGVEGAVALSLTLRLWNTAFDVVAGVVGVAIGGARAISRATGVKALRDEEADLADT